MLNKKRQFTTRINAGVLLPKVYRFSKGHRCKIDIIPNNDAPLCKCGCSRTTEWGHGKWNTYIKYHHLNKDEIKQKSIENAIIKKEKSLEVKAIIKDIISKENHQKPITDEDIVRLLMQKGIKKAKRTVAGYRQEINIQPFTKRRNFDKQITLF
jgi:hypothetical protein